MPRKGYRKPRHEARTIPVNVRLTPREKDHLLRCVEASEVHGMADFIRALIMAFEVKPRRPQTYAKLVDELARLNRKLARIDNNMNQLARAGNRGLPVSTIELHETLDEHRALKGLARQVLEQVALRR